MKITPAHVLICTSIASLSRWHAVPFRPEIHPKARRHVLFSLDANQRLLASLDLLTGFVEVLSRVVRRAEGRAIEIVKHQVHILGLLVLQVVANLNVAVHLDLYVSVGLPREGSRFRESTLVHELMI